MMLAADVAAKDAANAAAAAGQLTVIAWSCLSCCGYGLRRATTC